MANFCKQCGEKLETSDKFCFKCGAQSHILVEPMNLDQFMDRKIEERTFFQPRRHSKSLKQSTSTAAATPTTLDDNNKDMRSSSVFLCKKDKIVTINVGIIKVNERGIFGIARGSKLPLQVGVNFTAAEVLHSALNKHSNFDQYFCLLEDYTLVYPDKNIVTSIPGSLTETFSVFKYKQALGRPYSRLDLYICKIYDLISEDDDNEDGVENKENKSGINRYLTTTVCIIYDQTY